jgi:hypothetical protein
MPSCSRPRSPEGGATPGCRTGGGARRGERGRPSHPCDQVGGAGDDRLIQIDGSGAASTAGRATEGWSNRAAHLCRSVRSEAGGGLLLGRVVVMRSRVSAIPSGQPSQWGRRLQMTNDRIRHIWAGSSTRSVKDLSHVRDGGRCRPNLGWTTGRLHVARSSQR